MDLVKDDVYILSRMPTVVHYQKSLEFVFHFIRLCV